MKWIRIYDLNKLKFIVDKFLKLFIKLFNKFYKKNIYELNELSTDPVVKILLPIFKEIEGNYDNKHPREATKTVSAFALYWTSIDTAYRPARNLFLHRILQNEVELKKALEKEGEYCDYQKKSDWYDNIVTDSKSETKKLGKKGIVSGKEAVLVEEFDMMDFENKLENEEV